MSVHVYGSSEELAEAAAREFAAKAEEAIEERGRFAVVLAGGSTPESTYQILARDYSDRIAWSKVYVFFGDERAVPPHHEDSNLKMASELLLDHVPVGNVHRIRGELPPEEAAEAYEEELRTFFQTEDVPRFDLILLGLGADGHTASLFPDQDPEVEGPEVDGALGEQFVSPHHGSPRVGELAVARDLEAVFLRVQPDAPQPGVG